MNSPEIRNASDMSVYSLIWAYSPKVNYVYKSLYIYRVGQTSLTTSEVKLNDRITNLRMACEYISSQFKSRGIFSEHRLTLISQAECHLSNLLTYAKGTSLEDEVPKILSQIVKDCYDVEHTMYDHSVMGVGTKGMLLLSSYVHMDPKADYTCISGMSLAQLCDPDMQARFRKSCEENQHDVVIVDLIEEAPKAPLFPQYRMNCILLTIRILTIHQPTTASITMKRLQIISTKTVNGSVITR